MNWLERARREFGDPPRSPTANSADRNPTAVTAVTNQAPLADRPASNGSIGSIDLANSRDLDEPVNRRSVLQGAVGDLSGAASLKAAIHACCDARGDSYKHRAALVAECLEYPAADWRWFEDYFTRETAKRWR